MANFEPCYISESDDGRMEIWRIGPRSYVALRYIQAEAQYRYTSTIKTPGRRRNPPEQFQAAHGRATTLCRVLQEWNHCDFRSRTKALAYIKWYNEPD